MARTPSRRLLRPLALAGLLALLGMALLAAGAHADALTPESGGSPNADKIDTLYKLVGGLAVIVFIGVEGALITFMFRFKAKKGRVAEQIHGNTRLEVGWTVGAGLILILITGFTFTQLSGIKNPERSDPGGLKSSASVALYATVDQPAPPPGSSRVNIDVNGQQYLWRFTYPDGDDNPGNDPYTYDTMYVPEKTTITLDIDAQDVAHSWWIPKLGGKFDAIPGYTNHTWFKAPHAGAIYDGQCAELCGRNHANMLARVKVLTVPQYQAFIASTKGQLTQAAADRQKQAPGQEPISPKEPTPPTQAASAAPAK